MSHQRFRVSFKSEYKVGAETYSIGLAIKVGEDWSDDRKIGVLEGFIKRRIQANLYLGDDEPGQQHIDGRTWWENILFETNTPGFGIFTYSITVNFTKEDYSVADFMEKIAGQEGWLVVKQNQHKPEKKRSVSTPDPDQDQLDLQDDDGKSSGTQNDGDKSSDGDVTESDSESKTDVPKSTFDLPMNKLVRMQRPQKMFKKGSNDFTAAGNKWAALCELNGVSIDHTEPLTNNYQSSKSKSGSAENGSGDTNDNPPQENAPQTNHPQDTSQSNTNASQDNQSSNPGDDLDEPTQPWNDCPLTITDIHGEVLTKLSQNGVKTMGDWMAVELGEWPELAQISDIRDLNVDQYNQARDAIYNVFRRNDWYNPVTKE